MKKSLYCIAIIIMASYQGYSHGPYENHRKWDFGNHPDTFATRKDFGCTPVNYINVKAVRHFDKAFTRVADINWYPTDIGYIVHFSQDGIQKKAIYDHLGIWQNTVSYLKQKNLPAEIVWLVLREYPGYTMTVVIDMEMYNKQFYWIKLENEKLLKAIKVQDNEITELESFKKSL